MPSGVSKRGQFSAAYTINMSGFDLRQAQQGCLGISPGTSPTSTILQEFPGSMRGATEESSPDPGCRDERSGPSTGFPPKRPSSALGLGWAATASILGLADGDGQRAETLDTRLDAVAGADGSDACRCAGEDQVAALQGHLSRQLRDDLRDVPNHFFDIPALLSGAVHRERRALKRFEAYDILPPTKLYATAPPHSIGIKKSTDIKKAA